MQQVETAAALRLRGIQAEVVEVEDVSGADPDIVHFFGDPRPVIPVLPITAKLVVSPIYFPEHVHMGHVFWMGGRAAMFRQRLRLGLTQLHHPAARRRRRADFRQQLRALQKADLIVVNSRAEEEELRADVSPLPPIRVAYSGVEDIFFHGEAATGAQLLGVPGGEDIVLCVARIEPRKNQLTVARSMREVVGQLVLVGQVLPGNEPYLEACRRELPSLHHVEHIDHVDLPHIYAAAKVHILASWFETTGLSTIEALAAGRRVVVGSGAAVDEYFGTCAELVNPADPRDIRAGLMRAMQGPRGCEKELARRYTWSATATELTAAYEQILASA